MCFIHMCLALHQPYSNLGSTLFLRYPGHCQCGRQGVRSVSVLIHTSPRLEPEFNYLKQRAPY
jgi:hypothetical protein